MADKRDRRAKWNRFQYFALCAVFGLVLFGLAALGVCPDACFISYAQTGSGESQAQGEIVIEDSADLLTESEEEELALLMQGLTEYGNVMFKTVNDNRISVEGYAEAHYRKHFEDRSGILFMIDMGNGEVCFYRCGKVANNITMMDAKAIADTVKEDADRGDYFACAGKAFTQAGRTMRGTGVSRFTKYMCNICLGLLIAMLINFVAVNVSSKLQRTEDSELLEHTLNHYEFGKASVRRIS